MICHRCDPSDDYTRSGLEVHAADSGHPLCIVCSRSLPGADPQTCIGCRERTRDNLRDISDLYDLLPEMLGHIAPVVPSDGPGGRTSDERPLMGGDVLAMLANGSAGRTGAFGVTLTDGLSHDEHGRDERNSDPQSVAYELGRWEDDWRILRGEPAARDRADVFDAKDYLNARLTWAANNHDAFDEFAADMRRIRGQLKRATATDDRQKRAKVPCLECGTQLESAWSEQTPSDLWVCVTCSETYTAETYRAAVGARLGAAS